MIVFEGKDGDTPVGQRLPEGRIERETVCVVGSEGKQRKKNRDRRKRDE